METRLQAKERRRLEEVSLEEDQQNVEDLAPISSNSQNYLAGELQDHLSEDIGDQEFLAGVMGTLKEIKAFVLKADSTNGTFGKRISLLEY